MAVDTGPTTEPTETLEADHLRESIASLALNAQPPLKALRAPFPAETISLLPRATKQDPSDDEISYCPDCKVTIGPHIHLSYIGHATVTDRLLNIDDHWNWEPVATDEMGLPLYRSVNGEFELWIRLTVAGVTRLGVGVVPMTTRSRRVESPTADMGKKLISDAIKNAAMRFGVALELWSKDEIESLVGAPTAARTRKNVPAAPGGRRSRATGRPGTSRPPEPDGGSQPRTDGLADPRDLNAIVSILAHKSQPVRAPSAILAFVSELLGTEIISLAGLTDQQGKNVLAKLRAKPDQGENDPGSTETGTVESGEKLTEGDETTTSS